MRAIAKVGVEGLACRALRICWADMPIRPELGARVNRQVSCGTI